MSTTAPQLLSRKTNGAPSSGQPTGQAKGKESQKKSSSRGGRDRTGNDHGQSRNSRRAPSSGEKVVVRRLPPGMTETEFTTILGSEWAVGKGLVDWFYYAPGKVSSDAAKPSLPARAYLHLTKKDSTMALNEVVRSATWEDAKSTFTSPSLIAPPALEFAIYKKVPNAKKRTDARQGTIDQDPEFMAFLEGLANPAPAAEAEETDDAAKADTKVTTTPLVEYLKEKKANKGRDSGKGSKHSRQESGTGKGKGAAKDDEASSRKKGRDAKGEKSNKPTKDNVKILTKKSASEKTTETSEKPDSASFPASANGGDAPKSRRAGIAAAARLLQRDLGLSPGSAHRRARQDAAKADSDGGKAPTTPGAKSDTASSTNEPVETPTTPTDTAPRASSAASSAPTSAPTVPKNTSGGRRNRGGRNADKTKVVDATSGANPTPANPPIILKKKPEPEVTTAETIKETAMVETSSTAAPNKPATKASSAKSAGNKKSGSITPGATRGFVKHANSSQGVTESVLREALQAFGAVASLELDKRKGFAYVEFADHDSLVKAASASPITVAQGAVQVMERKDKKPAPTAGASGSASPSTTADKPSGGRARRGRGGGGGKNNAGNSVSKEGGQQSAANATASGG
ncbi:hypothetical protein NLU13_4201 [Sarocladium strictum]|uniref:RRM domain-containing protein n=1 Tax=Sarocladium strictum TaxID=5046 RepID=A0AA39GL02_SARSR|nr:hypothetical protein NLU13_4201 [Sarocladium strictum]